LLIFSICDKIYAKLLEFEGGYQMEEYVPYELKGKELLEVIEIGSKFSREEAIELKFYIKTDKDLIQVAKDIARDETTGPWVGQGEPTELFIR